jgi:uncharacterized protein
MKPEKKPTARKRTASNAAKTPAETGSIAPAGRPQAKARVGKAREATIEPMAAAKSREELSGTGGRSGRAASVERPLNVPPLLLEGDEPSAPPVSGPGQRYALGPTPPPRHDAVTGEAGDLPEAYGTKKLLLAARDPHWLYAHWDLTREQLREYDRLSADGHLVLRAYVESVSPEPFTEVHVHPESRNWFVHVGRGGTRFVAELGYYAKANGRWTRISLSAPTLTPPDVVSSDTSVNFASIPIEVPFEQLLAVIKTALSENVPLAEAILQLRAEGFKGLPGPQELKTGKWTQVQERALAELISMDSVRRIWMGSLEITELIRRQLAREISSAAVAQFSLPGKERLGALASVSSPFGGLERKKGFWFTVNAELIIYGATEADAKVTIGGREIKLRPDGSFSFRFSLPDGQHELPVVAVSADLTDGRAAELKFNRHTAYRGGVGAHPQDAKLKPPRAESVA